MQRRWDREGSSEQLVAFSIHNPVSVADRRLFRVDRACSGEDHILLSLAYTPESRAIESKCTFCE
jgi:hypothetical protein